MQLLLYRSDPPSRDPIIKRMRAMSRHFFLFSFIEFLTMCYFQVSVDIWLESMMRRYRFRIEFSFRESSLLNSTHLGPKALTRAQRNMSSSEVHFFREFVLFLIFLYDEVTFLWIWYFGHIRNHRLRTASEDLNSLQCLYNAFERDSHDMCEA